MSDLNNLTVQGRIVKNAEFTTTDAGLRIARFSIATNRIEKIQMVQQERKHIFFHWLFLESMQNT